MKRLTLIALALLLTIAMIAACSPAPTPVPPTSAPPPPPTAAPTSVPPTPVPPTLAPTKAPPTATPVPPTPAPPTATAVPPTVAPTQVPPTAVPSPTMAPGLYVSNIRLSPEKPAFNQNISFTPTFVNATGTVQNFTWKIYIWRADIVTKTDNETSALFTSFPVGTGDFSALGTYRYGPTGRQCEYYFARVGWLDIFNKVTYFTSPDGKVYEKGFPICDSSIIPTAVPQPPAPTAVPPAPGPGLFVTNMRLSPERPAFNQNISFTPTFANTTNNVQTVTWKVYIWRADTVTKTDNETSALLTSFPVGSGDYPTLGTYRYGPTGRLCEYYLARVGWLDANNKVTYFTTPGGQVYEKGFPICDVSIIPTAVPQAPAPTVVPPMPGPGLFVTNIRLEPFETPQHNMDTSFFPTFQNTSNTVQNFAWKVYIFKADNPAISNNETTTVQGSFPVGSNEVQALGTFRYGPTGYDCDSFFLRVGWLDVYNKITYFTNPAGKVYEKGFQICK